MLAPMLNPEQQRMMEQAGFPAWWQTYNTAAGLAGILLSFVLLAAGIQTLRRRPAGRTLHLMWAGLGLAIAVVNVVVAVVGLLPAVEQDVAIGAAGGMCCGMVIGLAYPIFLLIWFMRKSVVAEVERWGQAGF